MYKGVFKIFGVYWRAYGGASALLRSPYLHLALLLLLPTYKTWSCPGWWDVVTAILPNLLGFTLGGFAIFVGVGDEKFRSMLADPDTENRASIYVGLCSTFVHFIVLQFLSLLGALIAKSLYFYADWMDPVRDWLPFMNTVGGAIGFFLFLYALTSVLAATMHVLRIAVMYEDYCRSNLDR